MENYTRQQLLIPSETSLERTLRTGKIDFIGLEGRRDMPEIVAAFDDVIERPEHYYDKDKKNGNTVAAALGALMLQKAVRTLTKGTVDDISKDRHALGPSYLRHLSLGHPLELGSDDSPVELPNYSNAAVTNAVDDIDALWLNYFRYLRPLEPRLEDSPTELSDGPLSNHITRDMRIGLDREKMAWQLLMDAPDDSHSGYELNVLRSHDGLEAKALCMIVDADASGEVVMGSELEECLGKRPSLKALIDRRIIRIDDYKSTHTSGDWGPVLVDPAYTTRHDANRPTIEDTELMALARYHASHYDTMAASSDSDDLSDRQSVQGKS